MEERRNINRGFKKLLVWQDAVDLYILSTRILDKMPFEYKKSAGNAMDSCLSISRNIAEGYCRKNLKEYLNFLNFSLGSCGEFHSTYYSFFLANKISQENYDTLDTLHYKVENQLIKLIESLQAKQKINDWENSFA